MSRALLVCLFVSLLLAPVSADDAPSLADATKAWVNAPNADARMQAAMGVLLQRPSGADLTAALNAAFAPPKDAPKGEVVMWSDTTSEGTQHSIYAQAPTSYDATKPLPLLIWLHGGVNRGPDGGGQSGVRLWSEVAEEKGFLLLSPSARPGAVWWDAAGNVILRNALREMGRRYNIDRDRIAIGGFSDGASGCYHLLVADPTPYCCFFALAGHPLVARMFGGPAHTPNLTSRPVYATHGGKDGLYPTERMQPMVEALKEKGARIDWKDLPDAEHNWDAVRPLTDEMLAYWHEHPRVRAPKEVIWQTSLPKAYGRFEWIQIVDIDAKAARTDAFEPSTLPLPPIPAPRPRLGIRIDLEFEGEGLRILEVQAETPAAQSGMQDGDVITEVDGETLETRRDIVKLQAALAKMTEEDRDGVFVVLREGERVEVKTRPKALASDVRKPAPGHDMPLGQVVAVHVGGNRFEVGTVNVARFKLHLDPKLVDFSKPVVVVVNGKERFNAVVKPDAAYMLTEAHALGHAPTTQAALTLTP